MHERLTGPFNGYYIAAYACEMGELGNEYLGYYKICRKPAAYLDAVPLIRTAAKPSRSPPKPHWCAPSTWPSCASPPSPSAAAARRGPVRSTAGA
jgi:hypothetical protein